MATLCKPKGMPRPFWVGVLSIMSLNVLIEDQLPALKQDIRKLPTTPTAPKARKSRGRTTPEESSTRHTSVSASSTKNGFSSSGFSALRGESSATSAPETLAASALDASKKKQRLRSHRKRILQKGLQERAQPRYERYWNEFDNGSEGSHDEAYAIYIDPNASYYIPGTMALTQMVSSSMKATKEKLLHWLRPSHETKHDEQRPLIHSECSPSIADSDQSEVDSPNTLCKSSPNRRYSTFHALSQPPAVRAREAILFRSCIASFASSIILLVVAAILVTTGRRKAASTVDVGVIIGVVSSLVFAIMGVGSMARRNDDVGWVHRAVVLLIFICVALASGILLAALRHTG